MTDFPVVAAILLPTLGGGLIAWGHLKEQIRGVRRDVDTKASHEIVSHQYTEIIARLERIEAHLNGG